MMQSPFGECATASVHVLKSGQYPWMQTADTGGGGEGGEGGGEGGGKGGGVGGVGGGGVGSEDGGEGEHTWLVKTHTGLEFADPSAVPVL
jgi:hypothetical protein